MQIRKAVQKKKKKKKKKEKQNCESVDGWNMNKDKI